MSEPMAQLTTPLDITSIRQQFPILQQTVNGYPLAYLDNAASTQKPLAVIETLKQYYEQDNANIHRGVHQLSQRATNQYEAARHTVQHFLNAADSREIVFTRGTTESINLVAQSYGLANIGKDDEIIISTLEHHSNIVPWQLLCEQVGATLRIIPIDDNGQLDLETYRTLINPRTKLVSVISTSNAIGVVTPLQTLIDMAHQHGVPVLIDAAQTVAHTAIDVQALDCEFLVFSGHKLFGPTGIGVLYAKAALLEAMPPYQSGGDMIQQVSFEKTTFNQVPHKFEAGTPNIAGVIGLAAAIDYVLSIGFAAIEFHEQELMQHLEAELNSIAGIQLIAPGVAKSGAISFYFPDIHAHDVGTILDQYGVAIRAGHHCTMPLMQRLSVAATVRASISVYTDYADIDQLVTALQQARSLFA